MSRKRYLDIVFLAFSLMFLVTIFSDYNFAYKILRVAIVPLIMLFCFMSLINKKNIFFVLFLITFFIAEFVYVFRFNNHSLSYYLSNINYALSYIFLFVHIVLNINFRTLLKQFVFHLIILIALGGYIFYALDNMMSYHEHNVIPTSYYVIESVYNLFVILVFVFSFLQYIHDMNKRSLLLFLASLFLCFSELTQVAYFYIKAEKMINIVYSVFLIIGFCFAYCYINSEKSYN